MSELVGLGLNLKVVTVDSLTPHPRNYNVHSDEQIAELVKSLDSYTQYKNIVIWQDLETNGPFYIIAGSGLHEAAKRRGDATIVALDMSYLLTRSQAEALMVSDNFLPTTDFDFSILGELVAEQDEPPPGLSDEQRREILAGIKFDPDEVEFPEYDESVADEVEWIECPDCGAKWAA